MAFALAFIYENENAETIKAKKYSEVINQDVGIEISEHEFDNYMKDLQTICHSKPLENTLSDASIETRLILENCLKNQQPS